MFVSLRRQNGIVTYVLKIDSISLRNWCCASVMLVVLKRIYEYTIYCLPLSHYKTHRLVIVVLQVWADLVMEV